MISEARSKLSIKILEFPIYLCRSDTLIRDDDCDFKVPMPHHLFRFFFFPFSFAFIFFRVSTSRENKEAFGRRIIEFHSGGSPEKFRKFSLKFCRDSIKIARENRSEMQEERVKVMDDEETAGELIEKDKEDEEEVPDRTFLERVADLILCLMDISNYSEYQGLINFDKVLNLINKKTGKQRETLESGIRKVFSDFYDKYSQFVLKEKFDFLLEESESIYFGESKKSFIPLSEIYIYVNENDQNFVLNIEACLYFIFQHVCPEKDLEDIVKICSEFDDVSSDQTQNVAGGFTKIIGNLLGKLEQRVTDTEGMVNADENGNVRSVNSGMLKDVIGGLIDDGELQNSMNGLFSMINNDSFDANALLKNFTGGK